MRIFGVYVSYETLMLALIVVFVLSLIAQGKVRRVFKRYNRVPAARGITASEAAQVRKTIKRHAHGKFQALFVRGLYEFGYPDDAVARIYEHGWDDAIDPSWKGPHLTSECMHLHHKGWGDEAHPDTAIAGILSNYILGVEPTEPGFAKYRVNPRPSKGVTWAAGVVPTPWGELHVSWKLKNGKPEVKCREVRNDGR